MRKYTAIIMIFAAFIGSVSLKAQDSRLKRILDQSGLKYSINSSGNFSLTFKFSGGRSQLVIIDGDMEVFADEPIVEIWTPVYKGRNADRETLVTLLVTGFVKKLGGGELSMEGEDFYGLYVVKIPLSSFTPRYANKLCWTIAETGDDLERKLMNGGDDY